MRLEDLEVTHGSVFVNGLKMHYVTRGEGPLVVLLHGFPEMWWSWRYQIAPLAEAGFRVVAPDLRGYNETEKHGPYDLDTLATDVRALIDVLGEKRAHVVGHDWGGAIAWHLASTRPEAVDKLAVLNCPHPAMMRRALMKKWSQIKRSWYMFFFQLPWLPERVLSRNHGEAIARSLRSMAVDRAHTSDEEIEPFRRNATLPGAASAMVGYYRASMRQALRPSSAARYATIHAQTLLLWAMDDLALGFHDVVPGTERYASNLRVKTIERCGHFVQAERPDEVNPALIGFLKGA